MNVWYYRWVLAQVSTVTGCILNHEIGDSLKKIHSAQTHKEMKWLLTRPAGKPSRNGVHVAITANKSDAGRCLRLAGFPEKGVEMGPCASSGQHSMDV